MGRLEGRKLGNYRLKRLIGRGGMGEVYEGEDETLKRPVAVKVLRDVLDGDREYCERFLREAQSAATLHHPNICQIFAAGQHNETLFFVMEFIKGRTVASVLEEMGRLPEPTSLRIAAGVASALAYAHSKNIIHRDIKPENIMVEQTGRVVVMDFGLARRIDSSSRITQSGTFLGTPEYASPEQCETKQLTPATDVYSLGVVLYEMLTGKVPFEAETPIALLARIVREQPKDVSELNPNISAQTAKLVMRMLSKDPAHRPTAAEVFEQITSILKELPPDTGAETVSINVAEPTTGISVQTKRLIPRRRLFVALAGTLSAILAAVMLTLIFGLKGEPSTLPTGGPSHGGVTSIAVAPARNMTEDKGLNWLCEALADMLCADLAQLDYLRVVAPTKLKEMGGEPASAAAKLGAILLVESRFWVVGTRLRIMARVRRIKDGLVLASAVAEENKNDVFAAVDAVVAALHNQLLNKIGGVQVARLHWLQHYAAAKTTYPELPLEKNKPVLPHQTRILPPAEKKEKETKDGDVLSGYHLPESAKLNRKIKQQSKQSKGASPSGRGSGEQNLKRSSLKEGDSEPSVGMRRSSLSNFQLLLLVYRLKKMKEEERAAAVAKIRHHIKRIPLRFRKVLEETIKSYAR